MSKLNNTFELTPVQNQVVLAGILGDGNLKRNGSNYYYRETHGKKELGYCAWKCSLLEPFISKSGFHLTDKRDGQMGFQTRNSPTFKQYKQLSTEAVIAGLTQFGLCLYLLDDGWRSYSHLVLSGGTLSDEQLSLLSHQFGSEFGVYPKIIGDVRHDLSFAGCTKELLPAFKTFVPQDLDVFKRKIQPLLTKFKV